MADCECRTNFTWLPFRVVSAKPAAFNLRFTSRKGSGLSRPNLNLDQPDLRWACRLRWLEVELQRFLEIGQRLGLAFALAGHVQFETLCDIPAAFPPNARLKRSLHGSILSLESASSNLARHVVASPPKDKASPPWVSPAFEHPAIHLDHRRRGTVGPRAFHRHLVATVLHRFNDRPGQAAFER